MPSPHQATYQRGRQARRDGLPRTKCPYNPAAFAVVGKGRHVPTGERGFANAWLRGWDEEDEQPAAAEGGEA